MNPGIPMIKKRFMEMMNENQYFRTIEDEYLKSLPVGSFSGNICVVDHPDGFQEARQAFANESILGFDTETRPSFKKGRYHKVALASVSDTGSGISVPVE